MTLHFFNIVFLWLLIPAVILALFWGIGNKRFAGSRKIFLLAISLVFLFAVLLALSEPYIISPAAQNQTQIFLLDVSRSISDNSLNNAAAKIRDIYSAGPKHTKKTIVCFAAYPVELPTAILDEANWNIAGLRRQKQGDFSRLADDFYESTNIQSAILFAQTLIKQNATVYIYTDGLETIGSAESSVIRCIKQNINFKFETLPASQQNEVVLSEITAPQQVRQGQNAAFEVSLESTGQTNAQIQTHNLRTDKKELFRCELQKGINSVNLPIDTSALPSVWYEITAIAENDTDKNNNTLKTAAAIAPKPAVYVLETDTHQPAAQAIQNWLIDAATVKPLSNLNELDSADTLLIADANANILTPNAVEKIQKAVENGMGLLVFPGYQTIQDKLLVDNPFAELLPVKVHQYGRKSNPDTTVVFILDTSGSMTGARIAIAREIARQAISRLSPYDKVGIVEFYGNRRWAAPIQSASNQVDLFRAINRLTPGGGTVIMPAMEEAYYAMLNVSSTTKHIVVISDGGVEHADYEAMLRKMADNRIAVSTVLVGPATHTSFMAELSQWGQGSFFNAEDRFILPDINFKSVFDKAGSPFQQNTAPLTSKYPTGIVAADGAAVALEYLASQPKTASQTAVEFSNGQPFIAVWNYGTGKIAFCSSDIFHQNSANTGVLADIIANLSRRIYKPSQSIWNMRHIQQDNHIEFEIQTALENPQQKPAAVSIRRQNADAAPAKLPVYYRSDRTYCAGLKNLTEGIYIAETQDQNEKPLATDCFAHNDIPEIKSCQADEQLMKKLQSIADSQQQNANPNTDIKVTLLWLPCLLAALIMFLVHILIRRLPVQSKTTANIVFAFIILLNSQTFATETADTNIPSSPNTKTVFADVAPNLDSNSNLGLVAFLCGDYNAAQSELDRKPAMTYFDSMLCGYNLYRLGRHTQAYESFCRAERLAKSEQDKKYALSWAMLTAEKNDRTADLETQLLNYTPFARHHCQALCSLYTLTNNIEGIIHLKQKIDALPGFNESDKAALEQEMVNLSISTDVNTQDLQSHFTQSDAAFLLGQVRKNLINGHRDNAGKLLEQMLADANLSGQFLFIAQNAAKMAFYDIADKAAAKIPADSSQYYIAQIFRVNLAIQQTDRQRALQLLQQLQSAITLDDRQEYEISQYYEKLGQIDTAVERYQQIYARTGAMDVLMRVAWLCEKNNDFEKAYQMWLTLWQDCRQESLLRQIQPRLLEIASRTSRLAELAVEKEKQLEKSGLDVKTLELLIDIYVSVGDSFSAVELVRQYCGQSDVPSLERQYRIYLRSREYGRCRKILKQLMQLDPQHSNDYLRQLAMLAIEKGSEKDTLNVIKTIQNKSNLSQGDLEYIAGIWDLLEQPQKAMETYGLLTKQPASSSETWLLWAEAAKKANQKDIAINALVELLADETSDDLFAVAADALLNLDAEDAYLQKALTQTYIRIAQHPEKVFLYRLAIDILSEISKSTDCSDFLLAASAYSADGRIAWLQEAQRGTQNQINSLDYGMTLVYMDSKLPPSVCIELGKSFLELGEYQTAWFLFHKTNFIFDNSSLSLQIADSYDDIGRFEQAALVVREALSVAPDDVQMLIRSASYYEIQGDFPAALQEYFKAYKLTSNVTAQQTDSGTNSKTASLNVQSDTQYKKTALTGILSTMTTDSQRQEIMPYIEKELLAKSDAEPNVTKNSIDELITKLHDKAQKVIDEMQKPKQPKADPQDNKITAEELAQKLAAADTEQRFTLLQQAVNEQPASQKRTFMLELAAKIEYDINESDRQKYVEFFNTLPPLKLPRGIYGVLGRIAGINAKPTVLLLDIAEALFSQMPDNLGVNAFIATVRFNAGQTQPAFALAADVIDNLTRANEINNEFDSMITNMAKILPDEQLRQIIADLEMSQEIMGSSSQIYYAMAILYENAGDEQKARESIKQCFLRTPDSFTVSHKLAGLYENAGFRKELAEIISTNISNAGLTATLQWRNLVRLYYQTGQYDKMAQAIARDNTPLHNLNYLVMHHEANDVPQLLKCFRKYQVNMNMQDRFFSPLWPDWTDFGGIIQYRKAQEYERRDLYRVLASVPAMADEFGRYWQAITPQRSDFEKFADAYAYILCRQGTAKQTIESILQKASAARLPKKDFELLTALLKYQLDANIPPGNKVIEQFEGLSADENPDAWRIIAKACRLNEQPEKAGKYYRLLCLHNISQKTMTPAVFDDIENWLRLDTANAEQNIAFLKSWLLTETVSTGSADYEAAKTDFIRKYFPADALKVRIDAFEKILSNNDSFSAYIPLRFELLKYYTSVDDENAFLTHFVKILTAKEFANRKYLPDYTALTASVGSQALLNKYLTLMQTQIQQQYAQNTISTKDVIQNLSLLAVAMHQNNAQTQADSVLTQVEKYIKEPSLNSLWLADALRACGYVGRADIIERELENKGIFPNARKQIKYN